MQSMEEPNTLALLHDDVTINDRMLMLEKKYCVLVLYRSFFIYLHVFLLAKFIR